jgi:hypothetical protein
MVYNEMGLWLMLQWKAVCGGGEVVESQMTLEFRDEITIQDLEITQSTEYRYRYLVAPAPPRAWRSATLTVLNLGYAARTAVFPEASTWIITVR